MTADPASLGCARSTGMVSSCASWSAGLPCSSLRMGRVCLLSTIRLTEPGQRRMSPWTTGIMSCNVSARYGTARRSGRTTTAACVTSRTPIPWGRAALHTSPFSCLGALRGGLRQSVGSTTLRRLDRMDLSCQSRLWPDRICLRAAPAAIVLRCWTPPKGPSLSGGSPMVSSSEPTPSATPFTRSKIRLGPKGWSHQVTVAMSPTTSKGQMMFPSLTW